MDVIKEVIGKLGVPRKNNHYDDVLKNSLEYFTVVYNLKRLEKVYSPDIRKRKDFVMSFK